MTPAVSIIDVGLNFVDAQQYCGWAGERNSCNSTPEPRLPSPRGNIHGDITMADQSALPWPYWLSRAILASCEVAWMDAVWSVGGSPPYGGVSYEEGAAVYELLEAYRGPGMASSSTYDGVAAHLGGDPAAVLALEIFRLHDAIASRTSPHATREEIDAGRALAEDLRDPRATLYFELLDGDLAIQEERLTDAKERFITCAGGLQALAMEDPVYIPRLADVMVNVASLSVRDGDFVTARTAATVLQVLGQAHRLGELKEVLLG
jgi:hypothetical protein